LCGIERLQHRRSSLIRHRVNFAIAPHHLNNKRASAMIVAAAFSFRRPRTYPMDDLAAQRMPADYYRRQAAQARRLVDEATTPAVKEHLRNLAVRLERLAEGVK
jgi:hypothetical protein